MNPKWFVDGLDGVEFSRTRLEFKPDAKQACCCAAECGAEY